MATGSSRRVSKEKQQSTSTPQIVFRLIPKDQSGAVVTNDIMHPDNSLTEKTEMETKQSGPFPSLVSNTARVNVKNRLPMLSFKQMFRGPSKASTGFENNDNEEHYEDVCAEKVTTRTLPSEFPSEDKPSSNLDAASFQREPSLPKKDKVSYNLVYTLYDEKSYDMPKETKKHVKNITDQIPLQHSRALTMKRAKRISSCQHVVHRPDPDESEESVQAEKYPLEIKKREPRDDSNKACKVVMESVLVDTDKNEGKVLVLQVQDGEAVEAVSLGAPKNTTPESGNAYISYTERLFQEDTSGSDFAAYHQSSHDHDEKAKGSEGSEGKQDNTNENEQLLENKAVSLHPPLFMSSGGEMANLDADFPENMSTASSVFEARERYAPFLTEKKLVRFSTAQSEERKLDPYSTVQSIERRIDHSTTESFSQLSVGSDQSSSCYTGPNFEGGNDGTSSETTQDNTAQAAVTREDHINGKKESSGCSAPVTSTNSKMNPRHDKSTDREWSDLREMMHAETRLTKRSPGLDVGRDQSNVTSASFVTIDSGYSSVDLESITSIATGASTVYNKPLNIPVTDELKDMANELSRNPIILMKWLNPS